MNNNMIKNEKKLINTLINNTPIAYIIMDDLNRIHYVNESFLKLRGLEWEKTICEVCYNISNGGIHCKYCSISKAMESGQKTMLQRKDILPNGQVRYIDDYAIPLYRDANSGRTYLLEIMVNRTEEMQVIDQCNKDLINLVQALISILEAKDAYTAMHSQNVQKYATKIARHMNLSEKEVFHISLAALLHDIGKIQIPLQILNKPGRLTKEEFKVIQSHPVKAFDLLKDLTDLNDICQMVRHHHEKMDGSGYPDGIKSDNLDMGSRILAVADTYDAMTTDRSYRKALSRETAIQELERVIDSQLDADIVKIFSSIPDNELSQEEDCLAPSKHSLLVRELNKESKEDIQKGLVVEFEEINQNMDKMLEIIFENTPCGYLLIDKKNTVLFANQFILSLFGYTKEEYIGQRCNLFQPEETDQTRKDCIRMKRTLPVGDLVFDAYPITLSKADQKEEYIMYVILDRTKEVTMRLKLQRDYIRLIEILQGLLNQEWSGADMSSAGELEKIKEKAEMIAAKYDS